LAVGGDTYKLKYGHRGAAEREKAKKELADLERYIQSTQQKLENQEFVGKAPEKVVEGMRQKLEEAKKKAEVLTKKANAG
jgi:valyl-tRNA synthetase